MKNFLKNIIRMKTLKLEIEKGKLLSEIDFLNYQNEQDKKQYSKSISQIRKEFLTNKRKKK